MGKEIIARTANGARLELHSRSFEPWPIELSAVAQAKWAVIMAEDQEKREDLLSRQRVYDETLAAIRNLARVVGQPTQADYLLATSKGE